MTYKAKGRPTGEKHFRAKLSTQQVCGMREDREKRGLSYEKLAKKYNCGASTARDIVNYYTRPFA